MAKYVYQWKQTEHGRRLFRSPRGASATTTRGGIVAATPPAPQATTTSADAVDYATLKKDELIAEADRRGEDSSGTKADIIARLEADDD